MHRSRAAKVTPYEYDRTTLAIKQLEKSEQKAELAKGQAYVNTLKQIAEESCRAGSHPNSFLHSKEQCQKASANFLEAAAKFSQPLQPKEPEVYSTEEYRSYY